MNCVWSVTSILQGHCEKKRESSKIESFRVGFTESHKKRSCKGTEKNSAQKNSLSRRGGLEDFGLENLYMRREVC